MAAKPVRFLGDALKRLRTRAWDGSGTYRVIYIARRQEAIYVLHIFQKKSGRTAALDIELAKRRYASLRGEAP